MKKSLILAACFFMLIGTGVHAQSVSDRKNDYQRDLDIYRDAHAEFVVKKSEFGQFGTFASEEDLVRSTRQLLLARSDVWITYWQLLSSKFDLLGPGATMSKEEWQTRFKTEIRWLEDNKLKISEAQTREALRIEANALNDKRDDLGVMAFAANGEISVGMAVQSTKSLHLFNQGLADRVREHQLSTQEKDVKNRGLAVNAERINNILTQLELLREKFKNSGGYTTDDSFTKITRELDPLYTEINQQYQVAHELSSGVEW